MLWTNNVLHNPWQFCRTSFVIQIVGLGRYKGKPSAPISIVNKWTRREK